MKQCAICNDIKCRCEDCHALIEKSNKWWCDIEGCWCENITCCLYYDEGVINEQQNLCSNIL